jgi:hypothetical protein
MSNTIRDEPYALSTEDGDVTITFDEDFWAADVDTFDRLLDQLVLELKLSLHYVHTTGIFATGRPADC